MIADEIREATMIDIKVRNKIPEVSVSVTQMVLSGFHSRFVFTEIEVYIYK